MIPVRWIRFILPFWIAALIIGSFLPPYYKQALGTQSSAATSVYASPHWQHRAWHVISFGSAALLACLAETAHSRRRLLWAFLLILLGAGIEVTQWRVGDYALEWWDIRDDAYGVLLFATIAELGAVRRVLVSE